jgi:2-hydroxy-3-oxopropionate reductase
MTAGGGVAAGMFPESVGFIGLGVMGQPMAGHLLRAAAPANAKVHVFTRSPARAEDLIAAGAVWQPSAKMVAKACDVVVVMVPDLPDVADVVTGPDGIVAGARKRTVVVVGSTVSPEGIRELAASASRASGGAVKLIDAPVSGGEEGALEGTLAIMVGGADEDVTDAWAVLQAMGTPGHVGPTGAGQVAKACNQIVVAATLVALGEAAALAERSGLDVDGVFELLQNGLAGSRVLETKRRRIVAKDYSPPSGRVRFLAKDLGFAMTEAERTGTVTPHLQALYSMFGQLVSQGYGDMDTSVLRAFVEARGQESHADGPPPEAVTSADQGADLGASGDGQAAR